MATIKFLRTYASRHVVMEITYEQEESKSCLVGSKEVRNLIRQLELIAGWLEEDERKMQALPVVQENKDQSHD